MGDALSDGRVGGAGEEDVDLGLSWNEVRRDAQAAPLVLLEVEIPEEGVRVDGTRPVVGTDLERALGDHRELEHPGGIRHTSVPTDRGARAAISSGMGAREATKDRMLSYCHGSLREKGPPPHVACRGVPHPIHRAATAALCRSHARRSLRRGGRRAPGPSRRAWGHRRRLRRRARDGGDRRAEGRPRAQRTAREDRAESPRGGVRGRANRAPADRIFERARDIYRDVEGLLQTRAERVRTLATGAYQLFAKRVNVVAEEDAAWTARGSCWARGLCPPSADDEVGQRAASPAAGMVQRGVFLGWNGVALHRGR